MDRRFIPIYDELALEFDPGFRIRGFAGRFAYRRADRMAFAAVERARSVLGDKRELRADARMFLISNLALMVARPLVHPGAPTDVQGREEALFEAMTFDAALVIDSAEPDEQGQISAASVVHSLSRNMERLQLKEWRLWDRTG